MTQYCGAANRNRKLRILILTPWYPTSTHPYAGIFIHNHARAVSSACDVVVLHLESTGTSSLPLIKRMPEHSDPTFMDGLPCYRIAMPGSQPCFRTWLISILGLFQALRHARRQYGAWDVVHVHVFTIAWLGFIIACLWSTPLLISEHFSIIHRHQLNTLQAHWLRWCCRQCHAVLPVSHALKKAIQSYGARAHFQVIHNTVDTSLFYPAETRVNNPKAIRIANVNSLIKSKGVALLLKALAQIPLSYWWHLDILGDGPQRNELETLAAELGFQASVSFHGSVVPAQVAHWMQQADFFVLASESETFNVATAEALCTGLPVLVTRCGGPEEFVDESCGRLVESGQEHAMVLGLVDMMTSLHEFDRQAIARNAHNRFGHQRIGSQIIAAYRESIKAHANSLAGRH